MTKLEDFIETDEYCAFEIWSQNEMEYFFQDKQLEEDQIGALIQKMGRG